MQAQRVKGAAVDGEAEAGAVYQELAHAAWRATAARGHRRPLKGRSQSASAALQLLKQESEAGYNKDAVGAKMRAIHYSATTGGL